MQYAMAPLALGLLIGGMGIFSFMVAPVAFRVLPQDHAGTFVRGLFPFYYLFVIALSALAMVAVVGPEPRLAKYMAGVLVLGVVARQWLMPRINALRDRMIAGEEGAGRMFHRMHMASVAINVIQLAVAVGVTAVYVARA